MKSSRLNTQLWGKCLLLALTLCLGFYMQAQQPQAAYAKANALYKANDFAGAQAAYEKLLKEGYKDAALYYNLGNCYYKQAKLGQAILNYERAQRLNPEDEDITYNLKLANAHIADKIIPVPQLGIVAAWLSFTQGHSASGWGWWAVGAAWLALVGGIVYLFTAFRKTGISLAALFVLAAVFFAGLAQARSHAEADSGEAVLTVADSYVKSSPDDNSTNVFMIHEGTKFALLDKVGSYSKVRLADGKIGWVEISSYEKI